jgi:predicted transglutaminase-like cysteine proteinase
MELPSNRVRPSGLYEIVAKRCLAFVKKITSARSAVFARAVIVLVCSLACFGPADDLQAATLLSPGATALIGKSAEPFGLIAYPHSFGSLNEKWRGVERRLDDERVQLALCDGDRERCASPAALQFLAIVDVARERDGRARLGEINRAINLAIHPMSDLAQYGEIDVWSSPLVTFYHGAGDCEDYAIAKFVALQLAGISQDDLRIVVMRNTLSGEGHAVAAVRLDGHWWMLDNQRMAMVEDAYVRNYQPLFVIGQSGVMQYEAFPLLAAAPERDITPSSALELTPQPGLISPTN